MKDIISVFGLGKLGVPIVASFISKGFKIIAYDVDVNKVQAMKELRSPVFESDVQDLLNKYNENLNVVSNGEKSVIDSSITFVVVATPSENDGTFSNEYVLNACEVIGKALKEKKDYHLVVISSTVMPQSMDKVIKPYLEKVSGKIVGVDFGLCYSPEFIALGTVVRDFLNPDFVLIGESDPKAGEILSSIYIKVCNNNPKISHMNFINAEITKLAINTFITAKISFANMLLNLCDKVDGANVDVICGTLGLDSRIGGKYLNGATSYGGPCFPRDNVALQRFAKTINANVDLAIAAHDFNSNHTKYIFDLTKSFLSNKKDSVGILGLTYKPDTNVVEESVGCLLAKKLIQDGVSVRVYDPCGMSNAKQILGDSVVYDSSALDCIKNSQVILLTTPWKEFAEIKTNQWLSTNLIVIDCWRILKHLQGVKGINYIPLGLGKIVQFLKV